MFLNICWLHSIQNYIKQQIEERERLKREERDRRIKEEMEEEAKLQKELDKQAGLVENDKQMYRTREVSKYNSKDLLLRIYILFRCFLSDLYFT